MAEIPNELVEQFAAGAASVFAGAGISIGAGMPNWAKLLEPLRTEIPDCPQNTPFLDVAQFYENEFRRRRLNEQVHRQLNEWGKKPTGLHFALIELLPPGGASIQQISTLCWKAPRRKVAQTSGRYSTRTLRCRSTRIV